MTMAHLVFAVSCMVTLACIAVLGAFVVFDAQAARITTGRVPREFTRALDPTLVAPRRPFVVAHNAGDELTTAARAVAWGADAVEIDVRSAGGELVASHDAPLPLLEDVVFHGPSLQQAWDVAALRRTVLLHLKERSPAYLARVRDFVRAQPPRRLIVQTDDVGTLRWVRRELPSAQRLLLVLGPRQVAELRDPGVLAVIDGASVRDPLATPPLIHALRARHLATFVWTVDAQPRMDALVRRGVDGIITDRLDFMRPAAARGGR